MYYFVSFEEVLNEIGEVVRGTWGEGIGVAICGFRGTRGRGIGIPIVLRGSGGQVLGLLELAVRGVGLGLN